MSCYHSCSVCKAWLSHYSMVMIYYTAVAVSKNCAATQPIIYYPLHEVTSSPHYMLSTWGFTTACWNKHPWHTGPLHCYVCFGRIYKNIYDVTVILNPGLMHWFFYLFIFFAPEKSAQSKSKRCRLLKCRICFGAADPSSLLHALLEPQLHGFVNIKATQVLV